jgi:hypothetical protein
MKEIIKHTTHSVKHKINKNLRQHCFVILGYDFMIDVNLKIWLIEINKNPGLSESSNLIKILVPRLIDDSFKLTIDDLFKPKFDDHENVSPYHVDGYDDSENMWEYLFNIK